MTLQLSYAAIALNNIGKSNKGYNSNMENKADNNAITSATFLSPSEGANGYRPNKSDNLHGRVLGTPNQAPPEHRLLLRELHYCQWQQQRPSQARRKWRP
jgi:hypothetical protein